MKNMKPLLLFICILSATTLFAQDTTSYTKQEVIYGRRDGMALTMTVLTPKKPNGKAVVSLLSGGWVSNYDAWFNSYFRRSLPFVNSGYTVFLTQHASAPRYTIPDALEDVQRAVQYIRYNAALYHIDAGHIGITGTSSGGHLSLLTATSDDIQDPKSKDPVERVSSKVQAVAVFCPPTDFLNFGLAGFVLPEQRDLLQKANVTASFRYTNWDSTTNTYGIINDTKQHRVIDSLMSPAELATADDAPAYIMHGDADPLVPIQQSQLMAAKLKAAGIPVTLTVKPGAVHGWKGMNDDEKEFILWFDKYLMVKR